MTKEEIKQLKENENIKFMYKIPCSLFDEGSEYVIIGNNLIIQKNNVRIFTTDDWFSRINMGSILPYICSILSKSGKIKEFIHIYEKPNVLKLMQFIDNIKNEKELIQECLWGEQFIKEGKVHRIDVFKNSYFDAWNALKRFHNAITPIYHMNLKHKIINSIYE